MKTFPFYKQPDQMDCGPTCLRMIAKHYGKNFSLQRLRDIAGINKEGVSLLGISEAAEKIGFRIMGSRLTLQQLTETDFPVILHWNQNHFVILFKIKTKKANGVYHFADPAKGIIQYTETEFLKNWLSTHNNGHNQGIALMLSTTPAFYGQGGDKKMALDFGFLLRYTPSLFFEKTIIN